MAAITTNQPWQQKQLNQSGVRRLKICDADKLLLMEPYGVIPQGDFQFFEFIFPTDLSCIASFQKMTSGTGSSYWSTLISFNLPHLSDALIQWAATHQNTLWLAIAEDYNGNTRALGGAFEGLQMSFQASTGGSPKDANPMGFSFTGGQLKPFTLLPAYDDQVLFPGNAGFSYGFSTGFNA